MGVDMTMHIVKSSGAVLKQNVFDGRDYDWFSNMQGRGCDYEYDHLPYEYGIPEEFEDSSTVYAEDFKNASERGFYDFRTLTVGEFKKWYDTYQPALKGGWVSTYDKWRIRYKGYVPQDPPVTKDVLGGDANFITYIDPCDNSKWLYEYITKNKTIADDDYIIYYFDC